MAKDFCDFGGDTQGVGVGVVDGCEVLGEATGEDWGEGARDACEDVGGC